jgi:2-amino-1-hydroxyethylphosphonate dioxygenase (glycine-forming)
MNAVIVDRLLSLLRNNQDMYFGEQVSQAEHALQCAHLAHQAGADQTLVAAALLHDIGHLLTPGTDLGSIEHAELGAAHLAALGAPADLVDLIRGHVEAKRYLTAANPAYLIFLSEASVETLRLQGGPMTPEQAAVFREDPLFQSKLQLRVWDEQAKVPGLDVPSLDSYRDLLQSV